MSLVNPHRGECALEIGGRERLLAVDYNVLARIEDATGASFWFDPEDQAAREVLDHKLKTISFVRGAIAAALSDGKRVVRPDQVGEWLAEPGKFGEAVLALNTALGRFFAGLVRAEEPAPPPKASAVGEPPAVG